jgi:hypothetical protein
MPSAFNSAVNIGTSYTTVLLRSETINQNVIMRIISPVFFVVQIEDPIPRRGSAGSDHAPLCCREF